MGTFLCSLAVAVSLQQGASSGSPDSLRLRVARDTTDGAGWLSLGRALLQVDLSYHTHGAGVDTTLATAVLDSADLAFTNAATRLTDAHRADSARTLRAFVWGRRALLAWETGGTAAAIARWHDAPSDLRLPPALEELAENLLRACPTQGVLLVPVGPVAQATTYLRWARGLRPDLVVLPLELWQSDSVLRGRVGPELGTATRSLAAIAAKHPVCASMSFERPPEIPAEQWQPRVLVWVTNGGADSVAEGDFVFAALRLALDQSDAWASAAIATYRRAVAVTPTLCQAMETFRVKPEVGCR